MRINLDGFEILEEDTHFNDTYDDGELFCYFYYDDELGYQLDIPTNDPMKRVTAIAWHRESGYYMHSPCFPDWFEVLFAAAEKVYDKKTRLRRLFIEESS